MHRLKKWRIVISLAFLVMFLWEFIGITPPNEYFVHTINALQFSTSFLEFTATFLAGGGAGFILILIFTFIFGRVYCSFLCPLGAVQDIIIHLKSGIHGTGFRGKYTKPSYVLHYTVTCVTLILLAFGAAEMLGVLDPFANFGRMVTALLKPVYVFMNNTAAKTLNDFDIHWLKPKQMHHVSLSLLAFTGGFAVMIIVMAVFKNRFYCNTLCPVGGVLSLTARKPVFSIQIDTAKCTECGLCANNCKADCIDLKNKKIDFPRCVGCFNCIAACKFGAVAYIRNKKPSKSYDKGRREAIKTLGAAGAAAALLLLPEKLSAAGQHAYLNGKEQALLMPPGAKNLENFNSKCISCHLCISSCPSKVLTAQFIEKGSKGFLQPHMDFERSYCNYTCTVCSHVCPTGALLPLSTLEKKTTKIGEAKFIKENCLVYKDNVECLICNEYCPTKACSAVPYKEGLFIPKIINSICIGCGACENVCPARPEKAMFVAGLAKHTKAKTPGTGGKNRWRGGKDFPF